VSRSRQWQRPPEPPTPPRRSWSPGGASTTSPPARPASGWTASPGACSPTTPAATVAACPGGTPDAVIDELLTGITLPPGTELTTPAGAVTRHRLVHEVEATARCSWIDAWRAATEAGDSAAADAATVLAGARDWPIQSEIPHHADDAYWEPVESIVRGELPGSRTIVIEGDTPVEEWRTLIDC
jgi:hypothetical protein